jgi:hypothetical protein
VASPHDAGSPIVIPIPPSAEMTEKDEKTKQNRGGHDSRSGRIIKY